MIDRPRTLTEAIFFVSAVIAALVMFGISIVYDDDAVIERHIFPTEQR